MMVIAELLLLALAVLCAAFTAEGNLLYPPLNIALGGVIAIMASYAIAIYVTRMDTEFSQLKHLG